MSSQARLRTSCDSCQSLKIKCSQNKPECDRCVKHGLHCVYSPLRRMGRPRKRDASSQGAEFPSGDLDAQPAQTEDTAPLATEEEDVMRQWPDSTIAISLSLADSMHDIPFASDTTNRLASSVSCPGIASREVIWAIYTRMHLWRTSNPRSTVNFRSYRVSYPPPLHLGGTRMS